MSVLQRAVIAIFSVLVCTGMAPRQSPRQLAPAAMRGTYLAPLRQAAPLFVVITLPGRHGEEMDALIRAQNDPGSPLYRRYLTPSQFGRYFGAGDREYAAAVGALRAAGFTIGDLFENRTDIAAYAPVSAVEAFFNTPIETRIENGRTFFTNRYAPQPPAGIRVAYVAGLDNYLQRSDHIRRSAVRYAGKTLIGWKPADIQSVYDLSPLYAKYTGEGHTVIDATVGLVRPRDFALFEKTYSLGATLRQISQKNAPLDNNGESTLDVEWMSAIAPKADVVLVTPRNNDNAGFQWMYAYIANRLSVHHVVSTSWGTCEQELNLYGSIEANEREFYQSSLEGQWWLSAAGDWGSDDCQKKSGGVQAVDYPGSSRLVVSVGGTTVAPATIAAGHYANWGSEAVWNGGSDCGAGGGGFSTQFRRPMYQNAVTGAFMRQVPDVVFMADDCDLGGYIIAFKGALSSGQGGTSFAAPEWSAFLTLVQSKYGTAALPNPLYRLYALGASNAASRLFHNIVVGCNDFDGVPGYCARAGYSPVGGLGSFDGAALHAAY